MQSIQKLFMRYFSCSLSYVFKIWCVFYTYSASQFGLATFCVFSAAIYASAHTAGCPYWTSQVLKKLITAQETDNNNSYLWKENLSGDGGKREN